MNTQGHHTPGTGQRERTSKASSAATSSLHLTWFTTAMNHRAHNEANVWLYRLPEELQLLIFHYLSAADMGHVALVSHLFHRLSYDNSLWRLLFERKQHQWKVACNVTSVSACTSGADIPPRCCSVLDRVLISARTGVSLARWFEEKLNATHIAFYQLLGQIEGSTQVETSQSTDCRTQLNHNFSEKNWRQVYFVHHWENFKQRKKQTSKSEVVLEKFGTSSSNSPLSYLPKSIRNTLQRRQVFNVPIFGRGLDSSAKKLLYNMMWSLEAPFPIRGLHPGSAGVGSGVIFGVDDKELNLTAIYEEEEASAKLQNVWQNFVRTEASGLILVMDNRNDPDGVKEAACELARFASYDNTAEETSCKATVLPLLIFLCEPEGSYRGTEGCLTPAQVATVFELGHRMKQRKWCIRQVNPSTLQGVAEGLEWLVAQMSG